MPQDVKVTWILSAAIIMKIEVTCTNNIAKFIQNKNDNKNTSNNKNNDDDDKSCLCMRC